MSYVKEKGWETNFPNNLIRVRVQANSSYQMRRIFKQISEEKGLEEVDRSEIMKNVGEGPKLRQFGTFKDRKADRSIKLKKKRYRVKVEQNSNKN